MTVCFKMPCLYRKYRDFVFFTEFFYIVYGAVYVELSEIVFYRYLPEGSYADTDIFSVASISLTLSDRFPI